MTQFRVLPVRRGDAYLLQSQRGSYLVDGGMHGGLLPEMLVDRKARKLRAAVCSSTHPERLGGIIELMEAGHPVSEFWLPDNLETLPELARRFNGDWAGWLDLMGVTSLDPHSHRDQWDDGLDLLSGDDRLRRLEGAAVLIGLAMTVCLGWSPYKSMSRSAFFGHDLVDPFAGLARFFGWTLELLSDRAASRWKNDGTSVDHILRRMGWRLFFGGNLENLVMLCGRLLHSEIEVGAGKANAQVTRITQGLTMAAMAAAMLSRNGISGVRFFRPTGRLEEYLVPRHPLKCLNGIEVSPVAGLPPIATPTDIFREARGLLGQREGLTFQYGDAGCGVLFCGDTKMSFLGKRDAVVLDRPTVVAAPGQGYCSSDRAYGRIVSNMPEQDVWVRSHGSYSRKVSHHYQRLPHKCCLNNCVTRTVQEILFSFDTKWTQVAGGHCVCK